MQAADHLVSAAEQFMVLSKNLSSLEGCSKAIAQHKESADKNAKAIYDLLHNTLISPFDRHDIHQFTRKLSDVMDRIHHTVRRVEIYQIQSLPQDIQRIATLAFETTRGLKLAIKALENLKHADDIIKICETMNDNSEEAEKIMLDGLKNLFAQEQDCKQLLKMKEIYEYGASIVGECKVLANIVQGIVLEYS